MPRVKSRWALSAALAVGVAGVALAQSRPESILPPGFGEPPPPAPQQPAPQAPGTTAPAAPGPAEPRPAPDLSRIADLISAAELDTAAAPVAVAPPVEYPTDRRRDPALAGVLTTEQLGIAPAPWGSTSGRFLSILLRRADAPLASRWAEIGLRNMLLARAPAPSDVDPADWAAERAWLLLRLGEADGARLLVAAVDTDRFTPKMVQVAAQSALASSDPAALCAIDDRLAKVEPRIMPLVNAMCASLGGEPERAAADIDAARRRGRLSAIDVALADKVVGAGADTSRAVTVEWEPVDHINSWRFGLATATALMPPDRLIDRAQPQVRAWLARAPMFPAALRIKAARTAAALGVMSSDAMVDLYALAYDATDPDELGQTDPWRLRQAFVGRDRDARLSALRSLWGDDRNDEKRVAGWVLTARAATLVAPDAKLQDDAANLIAAMFAGGFDARAARWARVLGDMDDKQADAAWAMLALGAPDVAGLGIDQDRIDDFAGRDESKDKHRTALLVAGLAGLGRIDPQLAGRLNQRYKLNLDRATVWSRLIDGAATRRQPGTAMVLAASAMQARSIGKVPALYLFHAATALRRTGQDAMARMIAAEALARS